MTEVHATGGQSAYNDGHGIFITANLFPLKASKTKKRSNAKPTKVTKKTAFHEDMDLDDFLVCLTKVFNRFDLLESCALYHSRFQTDDERNTLALAYSITGTSDKNIGLDCMDDFKSMVTEVTTRNKPKLVVDMKELEIEVCASSI